MEKQSLTALVRQHLDAAGDAASGRSARTVYGGHEHVLRQTLIAMLAGQSTDEHEAPGEATLHVLRGRVCLTTDAATWEGAAGDLISVPTVRHRVAALEDSAVLLTVVKVP